VSKIKTIFVSRGFFLDWMKELTFANLMFVILSFLFGALIIHTVPPLQAPDELGHFVKAVAFANNQVHPQRFPKDKDYDGERNYKYWNTFGFKVDDEIKGMNLYRAETDGKYAGYPYYDANNPTYKGNKKIWVPTGGMTNYFFSSYIPQILAIKTGKILKKTIIKQYYLARYFNLFSYIIIVFFAIKMFRFSKMGATLLALNPMALFLAASTSGDAMIIAFSFFFVSWISRMIAKEFISNKYLVISAIMMINLVLMKPTLIVLGLLFFLIPEKTFSIRRKIFWGIGIFVACILFYVLWNKMMIDQQILYRDFGNPQKQVELFLKNPMIFFGNLSKNYLFGTKGDMIVYSFAGNFGLYDVPLGLHWIVLYFTSLIIAFLVQEKEGLALSTSQRFVTASTLILYTLLTFFALYQIWNKPGRSESIEGLQGRYFIPISLAVVPLFSSKSKLLNIENKKINKILSFCIVVVLLATIVTLSIRYPKG